MAFDSLPVVALLRASALVSLLAVFAHALRYRPNLVARPFVLLVGSQTLWATLVLGPSILNVDASVPVFGSDLRGLAITAAAVAGPILWLRYALAFTGRSELVTRRRELLAATPIVLLPTLILVREAAGEAAPDSLVGLYWLVVILVVLGLIGCLVVGCYLLVRLARRYRQVSYRQVAVLTTALLAPYLMAFASRISRPTAGGDTVDYLPVDVTFLGFGVAAVGVVVAVDRYQVFTAFPETDAVARDEVLETLAVGLFLIDTDDRILDANAEASRIVGSSADAIIGQELGAVLPGITPLPTDSPTRLSLATADGHRRYEVTIDAVADGDATTIGRTVLLRDITDRQTREQQLAVLTRVLRHNLRNDLDTILAHAEEIETDTLRDRIATQIEHTQRTATKARAVETVLEASQQQRQEVDLLATVDSVVGSLRETYTCELTVQTPATLRVVSHEPLLRRLLTELLENGIEHTDADRPCVELAISVDDGVVRIEISDDGPGIPAHEFDVLEAGSETPLRHGSGIGLWIVTWIVDYLGGDLSFESTAEGSTVRVLLSGTPIVDA
jgi:signal transduction histidine kinase